MTDHRGDRPSHPRRRLPAACAAATVPGLVLACIPAGPVRLTGGLILLGSFACAAWIAHQRRFTAIGPAIGLALAALILTGLALAAFRGLDTIPLAVAIAAVTLLTLWASTRYPAAGDPERAEPARLASPAALAGGVILVAAAIVAVRYSADSATADSARASSLAVWAYPSGGRLHIGAQEPAGQGPVSLRIVVTQAGITTAAWNDVRLAAGQTWQAPPLTLTGTGPVRVVARRGGSVVASFPIRPPG
jgi:hypothetical protein